MHDSAGTDTKQVGRLRHPTSLSSCPDRFLTARTMSVAWQVHTTRTLPQGPQPPDPSRKVELTERAGSEFEEILAEFGPRTMAGRVQRRRWRRVLPALLRPNNRWRRDDPAPLLRTGRVSLLLDPATFAEPLREDAGGRTRTGRNHPTASCDPGACGAHHAFGTAGFTTSMSGKRMKSRSVVAIAAPCSIASAARWASITMGPLAWPS